LTITLAQAPAAGAEAGVSRTNLKPGAVAELEPANLMILMSDQHTASVLGCYGNKVVRTPNLDALSGRGTRFTAAYANSPICIPSRTTFATGRYVHELKLWDNDLPYDGSQAASWGQRVHTQGHHVTTIGKLHYERSTRAIAFPDQRLPMYFEPDVQTGFLREESPVRLDSRSYVEQAGPGDSEYVRYDRAITDASIKWLRDEAPTVQRPWVLFVSLACPHFPLEPPADLYDLYAGADIPLPINDAVQMWPGHPALVQNRRLQGMDEPFSPREVDRARKAYYALVTFVDSQVGRLLAAITELGLADSTRIMYMSDHGESLGEHGLWWKSNMYDGAVRVPLIAAGPGVPEGVVAPTPVSLADIFPTVTEAVGAHLLAADSEVKGRSLWQFATPTAAERYAFSEYHADFSVTGIFMVRSPQWKYVHYVGFEPQLFDMYADPGETNDLSDDVRCAAVRLDMEAALRAIVNPDEVEAEVRASQRARVKRRGGVDAIMARVGVGHSPPPADFR
jgi:choline-sulfatase